ncbi:protein kinase domain-containing protein [Streptomyces sp. SAS_270]|uniref:protein kinase domain-containing protein n=1 Tax=Streptomyces sp. SAS_270 TaxID=3412748 RepID=UPI00403CB21E
MSDEGRLVAGRYRLVERIGQGGMGTVWRAQDEVLDRQVALKRLHEHPHLSHDELATVYERTRREARSAARIAHPHVVVVHDVVDDDGLPCIVMEYIPSATLADLLKGGRTLPPEEAARIGEGMVAALRAAHAADVLHRDVKPGNVLLAADGRVVLTDFGIALTTGTSTLTKTGEMVGSIDYMAPERMRGRTPGPASDLWALGATLYQAVEGRPPFRKVTAVETAYAIAVDPLPPMKQAGALEPLIEALLVKEPDERPSAEQTERALRVVREGGPMAAAAPTVRARQGFGDGNGPLDGNGFGDGGVAATRVAPEPTTPEGPDADRTRDGGGRRRRGGKRRGPLRAVVAVTAVAAAVAGGLYYALHGDGGGGAGASASATPTYTPPPVPQGYHLVSDKGLGVSFPVPDGWKARTKTSEQVKYTDPSGLAELTIGMVDPAGPNPVTHFESIEANTKVNYSTYRKLRLEKTSYRELPAAVWEFTFQGRARLFRAIDFGFGREGGREYDLYLSAPDARWDTYRPVFDKAKDGFTTTNAG